MEETHIFVNVRLNSDSPSQFLLKEKCKETHIAKKLLKFSHSVLPVGKDDLVGKGITLHQSRKGQFLAWSSDCWDNRGMAWGFWLDVCSPKAHKCGSAHMHNLNIKDAV